MTAIRSLKAIGLTLALSMLSGSAFSQQVVLDFEDLAGGGIAPMPSPYGGITNWGSWAFSDIPDANYGVNGLVRVFSVGPQSPIMIGQDVVFDGANVVTGLDFSFELYYQGSLVYTTAVVTPNQGGPAVWLPSGYTGLVDQVQYVSTVNIFGVDEFTYTIPATTIAHCFGDGVLSGCPCGNIGAAGEGCANSTGSGAILGSSGSLGLGADDLVFDMAQGPAQKPALLFSGNASMNGGLGVLFGDGLRCAGGQIIRHGVKILDASGNATWGPGIAAGQGWNPGDTRYYQGWFRDPAGPCGTSFNTSHALEVTYTP
jgi:hypothetical protein